MIGWTNEKIIDNFLVTDFVANGSFASLRENVSYLKEIDYAILVRTTDNTKGWNGKYIYVSKSSYEFLKKSSLKTNDLIIANVGDPGKAFLCPDLGKPMTLGPNSILVRPLNENKINIKFFYYYTISMNGQAQIEEICSATAQKKFNKTSYRGLQIPLPPLDQQKKIAAILDAADAYRQKTKALIEKYDELTQSLFLDMFGDPYVNQYNHAYVKLESLVKKKSDLVDGPFGSSVNTKVDYIEYGEIPVIRTKNIGIDNRFISDDLKFMTREKYDTLIRSQVLPGDIILTKVGTIGNTCIFPEDYKEAILSTTGSCRIRLDEDKINKTFFLHYLNFYRTKMLEIASAGVQAFLNMKHIKGFDILVPATDLQNQFAERVQTIELQKAQAQASLAQAEDLFNSLLQRAFKGELTN